MTTESYMPRAIGYRRISKEHGDDALGLAAQLRAIKTEAQRIELTLADTFTDNGVSGGAPHREAGRVARRDLGVAQG